MSFHDGKGNSLDLNNGLASRLLRAMGYDSGLDTSGKMTIKAAQRGIVKAREELGRKLCNAAYRKPAMELTETYEVSEDFVYLWHMHDLIEGLAAMQKTHLEWS